MKTFFVISISFIVALILEIIPLPVLINWLRPEWVLLVLIYWVLVVPKYVGINTAFLLGLIMDLLRGTLVGEHSLVFVLIAYLVVRFSRVIHLFPMWQQMLTVFLLIFLYQTFQFWIWGLLGLGETVNVGLYWMSSLTTAIFWPLVYSFLKMYQGHYKIYS